MSNTKINIPTLFKKVPNLQQIEMLDKIRHNTKELLPPTLQLKTIVSLKISKSEMVGSRFTARKVAKLALSLMLPLDQLLQY
jgi:hypothetical protein